MQSMLIDFGVIYLIGGGKTLMNQQVWCNND